MPPAAEPEQSIYLAEVGLTKVSMPWFVPSEQAENGEKAFVARGNCKVTPLINGKRAFGEVEAAILAATSTIDYITWGFDPAMRFTEGGSTIGEILLKKAETVTVRLLVWNPGYWWSMVYGKADEALTATREAHATSNLPGYDYNPGEKSKYVDAAAWYKKIKGHPRISFVGRPMDNGDVGDAISANPHLDAPGFKHKQALTKFATHHQKMVLVDYAEPARAKGFVLGSNTLPRYWDTDEHLIRHPNRKMTYLQNNDTDPMGADGGEPGAASRPPTTETVFLQPWQDISASVEGELLFDLNVNFARAWARAGGGPLEDLRSAVEPADFSCEGGYPAQVVRTQPQEKDRSISHTYFQNVRSARSYIYFENQYFRLPELTRHIGEAAAALAKGGRKESLYLFVVTNVPDDHGRMTTFEMLGALGKTEQMPEMVKVDKIRNQAPQPLECTKGGDNAGLQSVICTLSACDKQEYAPIYTHSKLMIIDDHFYTLGSANLNKRSMATDSEINVAVPDPNGAKALREKLWKDHRRVATLGEPADEFTPWKQIAKRNLWKFERKSGPLEGHLTLFMDEKNPVGTAYD